MTRIRPVLVGLAACVALASDPLQAIGPQARTGVPRQASDKAAPSTSSQRALLDRYCVGCHNDRLKTAGLALDRVDLSRVADDAEVWEKVVRKLRGGLMPPAARPRPDAASYEAFTTWLETTIDAAASASPDPGRTQTFHRNRIKIGGIQLNTVAVVADFSATDKPDIDETLKNTFDRNLTFLRDRGSRHDVKACYLR